MILPGGPLVTAAVDAALRAAVAGGAGVVRCSLDLGRSEVDVAVDADGFSVAGARFPFVTPCREHTVYGWDAHGFQPLARRTHALVKLVPTDWGPPTFEIDGVKMLPTATVSPWADAAAKVALVRPRGRRVLDTCGGLGYFAAGCLAAGAAEVRSFEVNPDVMWLRERNPWSPEGPGSGVDRARLVLEHGDIAARIAALPDAGFDAVLHDPPRFALAGELYSLAFYRELARVLRRGGRLFHYTGTPNARSRGRDLPGEVLRRLGEAGFRATRAFDGVLATR